MWRRRVESNLLFTDTSSTYEEALGLSRKDLASFGTLIAALLLPRFLIPLFSQADHFNDSAICSSHRVRHRLRVDVHCRADVRVTAKLLLNLQIHSQGAQQGRVGMPKRVPANPAQSGTNTRRK